MAIKANVEIEAMATRLAAMRGQSIEEVLAVALRAELAREPKRRRPTRQVEPMPAGQRAKIDRILEMVRTARPEPGAGGDRTAFLYDDWGLPN